ncbi:MAG: TetR family transcriptional regulator, partial [Micrococcales bacterium]|nr:TetR family transcriptional regulator [Micrococcales bacterium]
MTRDDVVATAEDLLGEVGPEAFAMRSLASRLGVSPNALYNHVASRDDLLTAVAERRLSAFRLPKAAGPWPEWLAAVATALHAWLGGRPRLTGVVLAHVGSTRTGRQLLTAVLDRLEDEGVERATAHLAWHAVLTAVLGSVQQEHSRGRPDDSFPAVLDLVLRGVVAAAAAPPDAGVLLLH